MSKNTKIDPTKLFTVTVITDKDKEVFKDCRVEKHESEKVFFRTKQGELLVFDGISPL